VYSLETLNKLSLGNLGINELLVSLPTECPDCRGKLKKDRTGEIFCSKCGLLL